ncbi:sialate O-acetylesterase [Parapedobacter sp. SGR-10]|uniref:sialate O-acetylesterase n=1 Tax=Parapedobacter sp. SGR-10 TaxID=2710879 RepID=UPI0013D7D155|nr:sialate O-acetylesterase [Parapedobacter sp. SGR-10]NGF57919.1 sialate O-acetylesterase [Parapedobacter sp. SGR-10]
MKTDNLSKKVGKKVYALLPLLLFFLVNGCSSKKEAVHLKSGYDLYLLIGQSNMAGRGIIEAEDTVTHNRVFALNASDTFVLAKEPLHFDKANRGTGPGLAFGKAMVEVNPKIQIGLIPAAVGGTKISYWEPGNSRGLYEEAIRKAKVAIKYGTLKGIIWQQGESDSNSKDAPLYKERLLNLLTAFRKDLGNDNLPIVIGGLGDFLKSSQYKVVNKALEEVAAELPNAGFSEASRQGHIGDRLHFNSEAQRENGKNMAKAMLRLKK